MLQQALNLLFPEKCVLCGRLLSEEEMDLCHDCRAETAEHPRSKDGIPFLTGTTTLWYYDGRVRESLLCYKFRGKRSYAKTYGRLLAMKLLQDCPEGFDVLTWVPVSFWRKFRRGYDQVELIARALGNEMGVVPQRTLRKIRHNVPQSGIAGRAERRANVLGVYEAVNPEAFRGKRILLLDDIITTGATASECARVLLTAGGGQVHCAAMAASPHRSNK